MENHTEITIRWVNEVRRFCSLAQAIRKVRCPPGIRLAPAHAIPCPDLCAG